MASGRGRSATSASFLAAGVAAGRQGRLFLEGQDNGWNNRGILSREGQLQRHFGSDQSVWRDGDWHGFVRIALAGLLVTVESVWLGWRICILFDTLIA